MKDILKEETLYKDQVHKYKNRVCAIGGYIQMALDESDSEERKRLLLKALELCMS